MVGKEVGAFKKKCIYITQVNTLKTTMGSTLNMLRTQTLIWSSCVIVEPGDSQPWCTQTQLIFFC